MERITDAQIQFALKNVQWWNEEASKIASKIIAGAEEEGGYMFDQLTPVKGRVDMVAVRLNGIGVPGRNTILQSIELVYVGCDGYAYAHELARTRHFTSIELHSIEFRPWTNWWTFGRRVDELIISLSGVDRNGCTVHRKSRMRLSDLYNAPTS